jgi:hypothetical protein
MLRDRLMHPFELAILIQRLVVEKESGRELATYGMRPIRPETLGILVLLIHA